MRMITEKTNKIPVLLAEIRDCWGDVESAATCLTTSDAIRFYRERGVDFSQVNLCEGGWTFAHKQ